VLLQGGKVLRHGCGHAASMPHAGVAFSRRRPPAAVTVCLTAGMRGVDRWSALPNRRCYSEIVNSSRRELLENRRVRGELLWGLNCLVADDTDAAETAHFNSSLRKEYQVLRCALCELLLPA
jgi:hypothetical protein